MWVKICGVRDVPTAMMVAHEGADAIGLNFYSRSPRLVSVEVACEISRSLPESITPVGLFVNHSMQEITQIAQRANLRWLQLHGDETPEFLLGLSGFELIRAFRIREGDLSECQRYLQACRKLGVTLRACLLDAFHQGAYGGTGTRIDWDRIAPQIAGLGVPVILAGGLTPQNVAEGIRAVRPWGVDTASGVETAPGIKDRQLVHDFVARARAEFRSAPATNP